MSAAYYEAPVGCFVAQSAHEILGILTCHHHFDLDESQRDAWRAQITLLQFELQGLSDGVIFFEFRIPRLGKRADCVVLYRGVVFVIEFKVGAQVFTRSAFDQVYDYALDLKNFHIASRSAVIVPVLVATATSPQQIQVSFAADRVAEPVCIAPGQLRTLIEQIAPVESAEVDFAQQWSHSGYRPTPTIVEAARALYATHQVNDIAHFEADAQNLADTHGFVTEVIERAKRTQRKAVCFLSGVPGAGKTLAGLNIATQRAAFLEEHAVFLSGNGPLVAVLREALARDQVERESIRKPDAERQVSAFIQNIHHFRDEYIQDPKAPIEKVVVFDEAQRAWTREQATRFMQKKRGHQNFSASEPEFLLSVMDRHVDWCVVVCLIGGGQEINTGEAGMSEWLRALQARFPAWQVYASSVLRASRYEQDDETRALLAHPRIQLHPALHLAVSMRSFRAEALNEFVGAVLNGQISAAKNAYQQIAGQYPMYLTRDLHSAQAWLRSVARGSERYGVVASSGAMRLRPEGLNIQAKIEAVHWFLNPCEDVRSSYALEEAATEFEVQGLELDWVCLAWDADLRWSSEGWQCYRFRGTQWQQVRSEERKRYLINAYRVLLTRARQGMVLFVPRGDERDATRQPAYYDEIFKVLCACGLSNLPDEPPFSKSRLTSARRVLLMSTL